MDLIEQLRESDHVLAGYCEVIRGAASRILKNAKLNDFTHSEAVRKRLGELIPEALQMGISPIEMFILIASAYLHDIGKDDNKKANNHGLDSARIVMEKPELQMLFPPSGDLQNWVAKICGAHANSRSIRLLEREVDLDVRPNPILLRGKKCIQPQKLAALLKLADDLECISDRTLWTEGREDDSRNSIVAIRIRAEDHLIICDFRFGTADETRLKCLDYMAEKIDALKEFLAPYYLNYQIAREEPQCDEEVEDEIREDEITNVDFDIKEIISETEHIRSKEIDCILRIPIIRGE